jgi:hypothetical protein
VAKTKQKKKRHLSKAQKADAKKSAKKHGRSKPGLWENVNASKGKGPKAKKSKNKGPKKSSSKGKTRPGKRSKAKGKKKSKKG